MPLLHSLFLALLLLPGLAFADVNINTADAITLARELKGVGPTRAEAIVAHRTAKGPFRSADELVLVKGIGQRVVDDNRSKIKVDRPAPRAATTNRESRPLPARPPAVAPMRP